MLVIYVERHQNTTRVTFNKKLLFDDMPYHTSVFHCRELADARLFSRSNSAADVRQLYLLRAYRQEPATDREGHPNGGQTEERN